MVAVVGCDEPTEAAKLTKTLEVLELRICNDDVATLSVEAVTAMTGG